LGINKDGSVIRMSLDPHQILPTKLQIFLKEKGLLCRDFNIVHKISLFLCMKEPNSLEYFLITYEYINDQIYSVDAFEVEFFYNPKVIIEPNSSSSTNLNVIIFDRIYNSIKLEK